MDRATATLEPERIEWGAADLIAEAWRAKIAIIGVALICAAAAAAIGLLSGRQYEATVTISPVLEEPGSGRLGGLGSLAAQYGGLASLAGINLPGKGHKDEALAALQSQLLTQAYIRDNNLLPILFWRQWDAAAGRWTTTKPPTLWKANRYFKHIRQVVEDRKSGMVILSIHWRDPKLAAKWANDLVRITNDYLRTKAIDESERNIKYLNEQASKTNVVEIQKAIYSLLQDEINKEMIAKGRDEYALRVVDPAFVPEKPSSLGPAVLAALGFVLGGVLCILYLVMRRMMRA